MSVWKGIKQGSKNSAQNIRDPWFWFLCMLTMIFSYSVSFITGWDLNSSITVTIGGFALIAAIITGILLIRNKIKTGKWFYED